MLNFNSIIIHLNWTICRSELVLNYDLSQHDFAFLFTHKVLFFLLKEVPQVRGIKLGEENKSSKRRQNCKRSEERWTLNDSCYLCNWLCNYLSDFEARARLRCWPERPCLLSRWCPPPDVWVAQYFFCLGSTLHWNLLRRLPAVRSLLSPANKLKK